MGSRYTAGPFAVMPRMRAFAVVSCRARSRFLYLLVLQNPEARIKFASGASLYESAPNVLRADSSMSVGQDLVVQGSLSSFGRNLVRI